MSFTFEPFIYNNESMYVEDVFEDYNLSYTKICENDSKSMVNKILEILKSKKII